MGDADLARTLQSLACGKFRILLKSPKGRDVATTDRFAFNEAFTCPLAKFKIAMVAAKVESTKEKQETEGQVEEERKLQIEVSLLPLQIGRAPKQLVQLEGQAFAE
jgi:cullin 3